MSHPDEQRIAMMKKSASYKLGLNWRKNAALNAALPGYFQFLYHALTSVYAEPVSIRFDTDECHATFDDIFPYALKGQISGEDLTDETHSLNDPFVRWRIYAESNSPLYGLSVFGTSLTRDWMEVRFTPERGIFVIDHNFVDSPVAWLRAQVPQTTVYESFYNGTGLAKFLTSLVTTESLHRFVSAETLLREMQDRIEVMAMPNSDPEGSDT